MKRIILVIGLLAAFAFSAKAQDTFRPGVYIQLQGGAAYDAGEASRFGDMLSPAAQAALGYRFSEVFGTRLSVTGWQGKNAAAPSESIYKYKFIQPSLDFQFDLASLFNGWRPNRTFNPYWFIGGSVPVGLDNSEANQLAASGNRFSLLWDAPKVFWGARTGLGADFRLTNWLAFNLELNANMFPDTFNSKKALDGPASPDFRFNALAGFTIRFGQKSHKAHKSAAPAKTYEPVQARGGKPAPYTPVEPAANVDVDDEGPAIYQGADVDIFFDLGKGVIRNDQILTMNRLVSFLRNNPDTRVKLDGYADKATGTTEINQELSEKRVAAVRQYLVSRGIEPARITTSAHGDTVQPFSGEKNRVVTCRIR